MSWYARERARERVSRLAGHGLDLVTFWREATDAIAPAVPHFMAPCWFTLDPASLLVTSHFQEGLVEIPGAWLAQQYLGNEANNLADVSRSDRGVATLHEATGGEPERSPRYARQMEPYGVDQEMVAGLRTTSGEIWGAVSLYREKGRPLFGAGDFEFMRAIAPPLAEGARRGLLLGDAKDPDGPDMPGLLVLRRDWSVESMTPDAKRWLAELPDGNLERGELPSSVYAVAGRALRCADGIDDGTGIAVGRVLSRTGRWIMLHGAALVTDGPARVAVIVEAAHPARISALLMAAYQLTPREQDVTRLVLQGSSTQQIVAALSISANTVQEHLKSVFEKTGVRSRRDLVGKVFVIHYEPRVRDNERRVVRGQPVRGGPAQAWAPTV